LPDGKGVDIQQGGDCDPAMRSRVGGENGIRARVEYDHHVDQVDSAYRLDGEEAGTKPKPAFRQVEAADRIVAVVVALLPYDCIGAGAAIDRVVPFAAAQPVVAGATEERVSAAVARQSIGSVLAVDRVGVEAAIKCVGAGAAIDEVVGKAGARYAAGAAAWLA
jgi:hypothetical protein